MSNLFTSPLVSESTTGDLRHAWIQYFRDSARPADVGLDIDGKNYIAIKGLSGITVSTNGVGGLSDTKGVFKAFNQQYTTGSPLGEVDLPGVLAADSIVAYNAAGAVGLEKAEIVATVNGVRRTFLMGVVSIASDLLIFDAESTARLNAFTGGSYVVDSVELKTVDTDASDEVLIESVVFMGNTTGQTAQFAIAEANGSTVVFRTTLVSTQPVTTFDLSSHGIYCKGGFRFGISVTSTVDGKVDVIVNYKNVK